MKGREREKGQKRAGKKRGLIGQPAIDNIFILQALLLERYSNRAVCRSLYGG